MARYGAQFGPDITFLGTERCDWTAPDTYADADGTTWDLEFGARDRSM